jgi:hypothetical protein
MGWSLKNRPGGAGDEADADLADADLPDVGLNDVLPVWTRGGLYED